MEIEYDNLSPDEKIIHSLVFQSRQKVTVCEDHSKNPTEYGISFTGFNPEPEDYFKMTDEQTADRLCDYLNDLK